MRFICVMPFYRDDWWQWRGIVENQLTVDNYYGARYSVRCVLLSSHGSTNTEWAIYCRWTACIGMLRIVCRLFFRRVNVMTGGVSRETFVLCQ